MKILLMLAITSIIIPLNLINAQNLEQNSNSSKSLTTNDLQEMKSTISKLTLENKKLTQKNNDLEITNSELIKGQGEEDLIYFLMGLSISIGTFFIGLVVGIKKYNSF